MHVHHRIARKSERDRVAAEARLSCQRPAELGQVPADGAERIVRVGEEQRSEPLPGHGGPGQQEERQQGPCLAPARGAARAPVDDDLRRPEQLDLESWQVSPRLQSPTGGVTSDQSWQGLGGRAMATSRLEATLRHAHRLPG